MKPNYKPRHSNGKYKQVYASKFSKKLLVLVGIIFIGFIIFYWGTLSSKKIEYQRVEVEVSAKTPILDRIAQCESSNMHWRNGQVLMVANENKSIDTGVMQINLQIWGKKATELGYNLTIEKDNRAMAKWIYENRGTEDWKYSRNCWMKN